MLPKDLVYLEDIEAPCKKVSDASNNVDVAKAESTTRSMVAKPIPTISKEPKASVKRQLSIADMFSKNATDKPAKRQKTADADASGTTVKVSGPAGGVRSLNSIPLNLDAFRASLDEEQQKLLNLELETMGKSWLKVLLNEIKKPYFLSLKRWLHSEGLSDGSSTGGGRSAKIYPPARDIYSWSHTPLGRVKVVIVGQDPYHGSGQAHGLCFSVPKGVAPPPSLKNIYAELQREYPQFTAPKHGNLTSWAANGVLLLNTCLTVRAGEAGSHSKRGWEEFTDRVVDVIDRYGGANLGRGEGEASSTQKAGVSRGVVFLAWGSWAQKRVARLDKKKHLILTSAHPSPLSAYRGFIGNEHFKKANEWLEMRYGADGVVDWCTLE
ncbi:hypothetical protein M422DRAFT_58685 [Sphaerobolus stellatus SS14]|nr:hypothetical protein M422DRAFT_58685 [Sphaerobolus stellatus SS14]